MAIIVMGVAGSGKTTIGRRLADRLGADFLDADDLHPAENIAKMRAGRPLDDADRAPWIAAVAAWLTRAAAADRGAVVACSALRRDYRRRLWAARPEARLVYLDCPKSLAARRLRRRSGHFMSPDLNDSQFQTLEPPEAGENPVRIRPTGRLGALSKAIVEALASG